MEEKQILDRLWSRDEEALTALAQHYGHRLQRLAHNILLDPQDAQECVNDTYLALWNSIPPKRPEPLLPYALRLCKNIATSRLRRNLAKKRSGYEVALEELCDAIGRDDLERMQDSNALGAAINAFLARQSRENRVIFLRRYWYGDSVQQIAGRLAMSENVVSARLARMKGKLRRHLEKENIYV
jgi:RNA polymerase sigma-70 factor (ECF subfamily)